MAFVVASAQLDYGTPKSIFDRGTIQSFPGGAQGDVTRGWHAYRVYTSELLKPE
jgi:hypothetical protein